MGRVYRARDLRLSRNVALKVLAPALAGQRDALLRLRREAETASRLNHPALVTIFDVGEAPDGQIFVAMELIEGDTLRQWLRRPHGPVEIAEVFSQAADGLATAHAAGVIHRDIKPENIMLTSRGFAKVVDFGLAKTTQPAQVDANTPTSFLTEAGTIVGTVLYMAPEQLRGETLSGAADVFSLGSVLHEALSKRPPFAAPTPVETITRILNEPAPALPHGSDPRLVSLVGRMLQKSPSARPSMQTVSEELRALTRSSDSGMVPLRARGRAAWAGAAVVLLVAAAAVAILKGTGPAQDPVAITASAAGTRPGDPAVAEIYSRAQFFASDRNWPVQDQSIPLLEEVVRRDPRFMRARVELAQQYARRAFDRDPDRTWEQKAFVEADRILQIDPRSPAAHTIKGRLKFTIARGFAHEEALGELAKALEADPHYAPAIEQRAAVLMHVGLLDAALKDYELLRGKGAGDSEVWLRIARIHLWQGDAAAALRELREYNPYNYQVGVALVTLGRYDEARAFIRDHPTPESADIASTKALLLATTDQGAGMDQLIADVVATAQTSSHFHHALYNIACAYAQGGDAVKAVEALTRVSLEGMPSYPLFAKDPLLNPIRNDERFKRFMSESRDAFEARSRALARHLPPDRR